MNTMGNTAPVNILTFMVGGLRYGLAASDVQEVVRAVPPVALPQSPGVVEGIINIRGRLVPVFDMRQRFGLPARAVEHGDQFIVAQARGRLAALHVDRAADLLQLDSCDIEESKLVVPGVEYVAWMAKLPDDLVLIHDLCTFLSEAESESLDHALEAASARSDQP